MVMPYGLVQSRIVGVAVNDRFKYGDIDINWDFSELNATLSMFPSSISSLLPNLELLEEISEAKLMLLSVEDVSGTNINFQATTHLENGTERTFNGYVDVDTGEGNMTFLAISANLDQNDSMYTSGDYSTWKINETLVKTYPNGVRETNHLNLTQEFSWSLGIAIYAVFSISLYWDRATGILVETSGKGTIQIEEKLTTWSMLMRITESDVWVIPEFPKWTPMLVTLIALAVALAIYKRRLHETPIH